MTSKRNSLPSLTMNKFFVSKRASMFEICEEEVREKRERSPCGVLDVSERKLKARKDSEKKAAMERRKKRQADPYAEESTELEDTDTLDIEKKLCGHSNRSVNFGCVKRCLKQSLLPLGECSHCNTSKPFSDKTSSEAYHPVIWLCAYCGYQGCDRNTGEKHAFRHYKTPHSDPHCIVINTQYFTVWCYECDSEVVDKSSKKLHEVINYVKRLSERAPKKSLVSQLTVSKPSTNLTTQYSGSDSRLYTRKSYEDIAKASKTQKHYQAQANMNASLPKVKGLSNLGNTCFFNSVLQNLAQTHFLTQTLDIQLQSGTRISLPGSLPEDYKKLLEKKTDGNSEDEEDSEIVELKPMDVFLPEGGGLSLALGVYLRDMSSAKKNGAIHPGHLFGQICKKRVQFQGNRQQDAHELLRCLLDAIRTEEIRRTERAILKAFALNEKTDVNNINSRLRKMIKGYGKQGTHTIIDQIFGGQLISTVICEECQWSSQVFEPFMDLSLPVNEEKGKPKNWNYSSEDVTQSTHSLHGADSLRKHAMKNHRKEEKRRNRKNRSQGTRSTGATSNSPCPILIKQVSLEKENKKARRMTEKRRPEDEEEFRLKEEQEKRDFEERRKKGAKRKGESSKFKLLMEARNAARREERGSELEEEDSDEELEYDHDDEEEDDSLYTLKKTKKKEEKVEDEEEEEEVEEEEVEEEEVEEEEVEEEEEEEEEETEETETTETESEATNNVKSKSKNVSRETSDADVEDNTDSEHERIIFINAKRHPSIVVDEFATDASAAQESTEIDNRYLRTSSSFDQLNYSSDCSERYYTAAGPDTNDELDNVTADRASCNTTSGKGDSISSGTYEEYRCSPKVIVDSGQIDEMGFKMEELKIRHRSSSKESLLDSHKGCRRDSHENLSFNNTERLNEDWTQHKKSILKKLKQDWIARSLTTLVPRYHSERQECSVMSCISNFMSPELLTGMNKVSCENCKKRLQSEDVKSNASKQLLILSPPAVLTLHLKRFSHAGVRLTKVNRFVQFPLVLDIAAFTSSMSLGLSNMSKGQTQVLYGLYGIVEHSGRLDSGHYVAYVRVRSVDSSKISKQMLNVKPWNQFDINHMVTDLASKNESDKSSLNGGFRFHHLPFHPLNPESVEEEIKTGRWFFVSDTYVNEVNIEKVLKAQAYLLFYERII